VIYLDSSALLKLVFEEPESAALETWLSDRADYPLVSSELAQAEVIRAARRMDPRSTVAARDLLGGVDLIPLDGSLIAAAGDIGPPMLRTLDAIHLASALSVRDDLTDFVAYDHRLREAAHAAGLHPARPGAE
jgi:predicted nucleic acid-binding protein